MDEKNDEKVTKWWVPDMDDMKHKGASFQFDVVKDDTVFPALWEFLGEHFFFCQELKEVDPDAIKSLTIKVCFEEGHTPSRLFFFPAGSPKARQYFKEGSKGGSASYG